MNANDKPWETVRISKDKLKHKIDSHRLEAFILCDRDCWCWDAESLVNACEYRDEWDRQAGIGWRPEQFSEADARHALTGE